MSWGTSYNGSDNIHFNFPPIMDDGRNFSNYESGAGLDNKLKETANIRNNSDYRKYLQINADSIIKNNQLTACNECCATPFYSNKTNNMTTTKPYIFDSILSDNQPYGYESSDLKNIFISRQMLNAQLHAPRFKIPTNEIK
tara:strand:+ start:161 stop:583 length:423 start_codon:yes stop_codon:yes gene_type:complete